MRDRRDYVIAALAAALLFCLGLIVGGGAVLPPAQAQDTTPGTSGDGTINIPVDPPFGDTINPPVLPDPRPGLEGRTSPPTASDSDSNNRFVSVTMPIGSGESVLTILDSETERLLMYRYIRGKGVQLVGARQIDFDLKLQSYKDFSQWTRQELRRLFDKERARAAAKASKGK